MTDPFLIAHKVRGEPAFDVAIQMTCPHCLGYPFGGYPEDLDHPGCHECDEKGYWWIIPTSGHRAYPIMHWELSDLLVGDTRDGYMSVTNEAGPLEHHPAFDSLPDHYPTRSTPTLSLVDALGLRKPKAEASPTPVARRF
jgi:hypothetical protein